jgi:hypothetical protein
MWLTDAARYAIAVRNRLPVERAIVAQDEDEMLAAQWIAACIDIDYRGYTVQPETRAHALAVFNELEGRWQFDDVMEAFELKEGFRRTVID